MSYVRCKHCDSAVNIDDIEHVMSQTDSEISYKCLDCGYISNSKKFHNDVYEEVKEKLVLISDIALDNDGYEEPEDLKKLIQELRGIARDAIRILNK